MLASMSMTDDESNPQINATSYKDKAMLIFGRSFWDFVSISEDKCLVGDLLIQNYEVIARVDNPDGMRMWDTFKVPCMSGV